MKKLLLIILTQAVLLSLITSCQSDKQESEIKMTASEALAKHTDSLMAIDGVIGMAVGLEDSREVIMVQISNPAASESLPDDIEGFKLIHQLMDSPELF